MTSLNQQYKICPMCHNTLQVCQCNPEPKKEWVGLTDDEIKNSMQGHNTQVDFAKAIEEKLKEKNT